MASQSWLYLPSPLLSLCVRVCIFGQIVMLWWSQSSSPSSITCTYFLAFCTDLCWLLVSLCTSSMMRMCSASLHLWRVIQYSRNAISAGGSNDKVQCSANSAHLHRRVDRVLWMVKETPKKNVTVCEFDRQQICMQSRITHITYVRGKISWENGNWLKLSLRLRHKKLYGSSFVHREMKSGWKALKSI